MAGILDPAMLRITELKLPLDHSDDELRAAIVQRLGISDEQLLDAQLHVDDPESLGGLSTEVPVDGGEPYVEFKYDLRGSGRAEGLTCVHGHKHLAGFVMRKGNARFLVGWMCGQSIYGEDFDQYKSDFNAAINRKDNLRRRREIEAATEPFMKWLQEISDSDIFNHYDRVRRQIKAQMPWVWENGLRASHIDTRVVGLTFPKKLFDEGADPRVEFGRICSDFGIAVMTLITKSQTGALDITPVKRRMDLIIQRIETVFSQLKEIEAFFQPAVLEVICKLANEYDNPKKRRYVSGLLCLTCKKDREKVTIQMPRNYRFPDRHARGMDRQRGAGPRR